MFANSFHGDEALFASWARQIAVWRDPLLTTQLVDKPPLLFYLQALFYPLLGPVEWAARLPNWIASLLLVPLVGRKVYGWFRDWQTAVIATLFLAFSPLAIQFSPTAFTDPLLVLWLWLSLPTAKTKSHHVGLFFGLALLTKHQAWLFLPLIVVLGWHFAWEYNQWRNWFLGWLPALVLLVGWEIGRSGTFALWTRQIDNFGGLRLIWSWELWPRLAAWGELGQTAVSSIPILIALAASLLVILWRTFRGQKTAIANYLVLFVVGYIAFHWLVAIPTWERYLLPIWPLLAAIFAYELSFLDHAKAQRHKDFFPHLCAFAPLRAIFLIPFLAILLWVPAVQAQNGRLPLGSTPTSDDGAATVAAYLADQPYGTVLYDHWYSWQWRYHLFDKRVFVSWFPHGDALLDDLAVFSQQDGVRFIVLPKRPVSQAIHRILRNANYQLTPIPLAADTEMSLYRLSQGATP
ncbi:MAG: glycosyltransferase family 39 protein [Chloroflexota bacterium]